MRKRIGLVAAIATALSLVAWFICLRPPFLGGNVSYLAVTGRSMEPVIQGGDLAVLRREAAYDVGDVITFRADGGLVIHRIIGGNAEEGYVVKGDNKAQIDPWTPQPQHIVGRMWFRIPMFGLVVNQLRQPVTLGLAVAGVSMLSLLGAGGTTARRLRRRRRNVRSGSATVSNQPRPRSWRPSVPKVAAATFAVLAAISAAAAAYAHTQPLHDERFVEHGRIEHASAFDYNIYLHPSSLYGATALAATELTPASPEVSAARLYANLVRDIDLRFNYDLTSPWIEPTGEYSADLVIVADQGWTKTLPLVDSTTFSGPSVEFDIPLDLQSVVSLIGRIEEETQFKPSAYDLSVVPRLRAWGEAGPDSAEEFAASLPIRLNANEIAFGTELRSSATRVLGDSVHEDAGISWLGRGLTIETLRWLGLAGLGFALLAFAASGVLLVRGRGHLGEAARLRARDRSAIIAVTATDFPSGGTRIRLASLRDLVRFAQREERSIFRADMSGCEHYFVITETATYEYEIEGGEQTPSLDLLRVIAS